MMTAQETRKHLFDRAAQTDTFRSRIQSDPKAVIAEEFGITAADHIQIHVHEDSESQARLILPPIPKLDETQLAAVAGGCCGNSDSGTYQGIRWTQVLAYAWCLSEKGKPHISHRAETGHLDRLLPVAET